MSMIEPLAAVLGTRSAIQRLLPYRYSSLSAAAAIVTLMFLVALHLEPSLINATP